MGRLTELLAEGGFASSLLFTARQWSINIWRLWRTIEFQLMPYSNILMNQPQFIQASLPSFSKQGNALFLYSQV